MAAGHDRHTGSDHERVPDERRRPARRNHKHRSTTRPFTFGNGVVGHRPNRLDKHKLEELAATMTTILSTTKMKRSP